MFRIPNNEQLNTKFTNPDLAVNNVINGMTIFNCGFKLQNGTQADTVKKYEVWLDNLVQQRGQVNFVMKK